jgi:hypothetical protein
MRAEVSSHCHLITQQSPAHAAVTTSRHVCSANAGKARCVLAEVRGCGTLKGLFHVSTGLHHAIIKNSSILWDVLSALTFENVARCVAGPDAPAWLGKPESIGAPPNAQGRCEPDLSISTCRANSRIMRPDTRKRLFTCLNPKKKLASNGGPHTINTPLQLLHVLAAVDCDIGSGHERRLVRA